MKTILMMSMFLLIGCQGKGGGSTNPDVSSSDQVDLTIEYQSYGVYQNTGSSLDGMVSLTGSASHDVNRSMIIPEVVSLITDSASSVQLNDVARIQFANSYCDYKYDGTNFYFFQCYNLLAGAQYGDVIYLSDLAFAPNAQLDDRISFGVIRPAMSNHTGNIIIRANLQ